MEVRPRRLRTTRVMRAMVAETSVEARQLVLPLFVAEGLSEPRPIGSMPGVVQHSRESLRKAAAEAAAAGLAGVMLFGVPEHKDARGTQALDDDGILNVALRDVAVRGRGRPAGHVRRLPGRVHRPRPLRRAHRRRHGRQRRDGGDLRRDGGRPRRGGSSRRRAQRDDGRPGGGDPVRAGRRGAAGHRDHGLRREVRFRLLRPVPGGGRLVPAGRSAHATSRIRPTGGRRCEKCCSTSPRAPTWSWSSRRWPTSTCWPTSAQPSTSRSPPTTCPASTRWSRRPPRRAGSTVRRRSRSRSSPSGGPGPT